MRGDSSSVEQTSDRKSRSKSRSHRRHSSSESKSRSVSHDRKRKHKKKSKRRRRSSSSSSSSTDQEEKARRKAIKKLEKKKLKEEVAVQNEAQIAAHMAASLGYGNKDNPFGDDNLKSKFVWIKKRQNETKMGMTSEQRSIRDSLKKQETMAQLDKLKQRRQEREHEQRLRQEEQARMQREQDRLLMGDWESKQDEFHLQQAKARAQIRIQQGRARPIDILAMNLSLATDSELAQDFDWISLDLEMDEPPYVMITRLTLNQVEELQRDVTLYMQLEKDQENKQFWQSMLLMCDDEVAKRQDRSHYMGLSRDVLQDIERLLSNKTVPQLDQLYQQVQAKLASGEPIDVEYWHVLLREIILMKSKMTIKDMYQELLRKRIDMIKKAQSVAQEAMQTETSEHPGIQVEEYDPTMSPRRVSRISPQDKHLPIIDAESEWKELASLIEKRKHILQVKKTSGKKKAPVDVKKSELEDKDTAFELKFIEEALRTADSDEENMEESVPQDRTHEKYLWKDKYRPRKPRYFNRVHTGYEWNQYNQTHYDINNPPPKTVQGYKFNIFYPDLMDKTQTPIYKLLQDEGYPDTVVIRFSAGPPYEDIAFRIVNKPWDHSHKRGFRCSFDKGVLQLHFRFKRLVYRR